MNRFSDTLLSLAPLKQPVNRGLGFQVNWKIPSAPFKLNTDGSSINNANHSGAGIVIRDVTGRVVVAKSIYLSRGDSLEAEAKALSLGLEVAYNLEISEMQVETDSQLLIKMITGASAIPWRLIPIIRNIKLIQGEFQISFSHIFREANSVADFLAKLATSSKSNQVFQHSNMPRVLRGLVQLDAQEFPYVRI